jgi:hypothetical protein
MRNSIYQSLSDSDKKNIQDNMKLYPQITGMVYDALNNNYYVTDITVGTLLSLSSILGIYNLSSLIDHLFDATQVNK